jgi:hypothetical protein
MNNRKILVRAASVLAALTASSAVADRDDRVDLATEKLVAARQKFFGAENVDERTGRVRDDKVIFSWITNASFAASVKGRVILLDTFVTRLENPAGRTPFTINDLVDLKPEALFIGHGHFDHADNAAYISHLTGAVIYASPDTCRNMQIDAARIFGTATKANCVSLTSSGTLPAAGGTSTPGPSSLPGAELVTIRQLEPIATITAFKHLHSTNTAPQDKSFPPVVVNSPMNGVCAAPCNLADSRDASMFPKGRAEPLLSTIQTDRTGFGGPVSIYYSFKLRGDNRFTFVWHNTTGALREGCALPNNLPKAKPTDPSVPSQFGQDSNGCFGPAVGEHLAQIMEALGPTDVEIGSVVSLGFGINGERDIVDYNTHVAPKVFIPNHVTAVAVESSSLEWKVGYEKVQDAMGIPAVARPDLIWLVDPNDYLRPIVFDPKDARWAKPHTDRDDKD